VKKALAPSPSYGNDLEPTSISTAFFAPAALPCASNSALSFNPSFNSGMPVSWHFIFTCMPTSVTSHARAATPCANSADQATHRAQNLAVQHASVGRDQAVQLLHDVKENLHVLSVRVQAGVRDGWVAIPCDDGNAKALAACARSALTSFFLYAMPSGRHETMLVTACGGLDTASLCAP